MDKQFEKNFDEFMREAKELQEQSYGSGSPETEKQIAKTLAAQANYFDSLNNTLSDIKNEQRNLRKSIYSLNNIDAKVKNTVEQTARNWRQDHVSELNDMSDKTDLIVQRFTTVDSEAKDTFSEAVKRATRRITKWSAISAAIIVVLALFGGLLACIGAFFSFQVFPPLQQFYADNGIGGVVGICVIALIIIMIIIWIIARVREW